MGMPGIVVVGKLMMAAPAGVCAPLYAAIALRRGPPLVVYPSRRAELPRCKLKIRILLKCTYLKTSSTYIIAPIP